MAAAVVCAVKLKKKLEQEGETEFIELSPDGDFGEEISADEPQETGFEETVTEETQADETENETETETEE